MRVHDLVPPAVWGERYDEINAWEAKRRRRGNPHREVRADGLPGASNSTDSQERLDRPDKFWKYNPHDLDERGYWDAYMEAYQAVFDRVLD